MLEGEREREGGGGGEREDNHLVSENTLLHLCTKHLVQSRNRQLLECSLKVNFAMEWGEGNYYAYD